MSSWRLPLLRRCRPHPVFPGASVRLPPSVAFLGTIFLGTGKLSSNAGFVRDRSARHSAARNRLILEPIVFLKTNQALAE
jgi:hypothetical protein